MGDAAGKAAGAAKQPGVKQQQTVQRFAYMDAVVDVGEIAHGRSGKRYAAAFGIWDEHIVEPEPLLDNKRPA